MIMDRLLIQRRDVEKIDATDEDIGRWVEVQVVQLSYVDGVKFLRR